MHGCLCVFFFNIYLCLLTYLPTYPSFTHLGACIPTISFIFLLYATSARYYDMHPVTSCSSTYSQLSFICLLSWQRSSPALLYFFHYNHSFFTRKIKDFHRLNSFTCLRASISSFRKALLQGKQRLSCPSPSNSNWLQQTS